MSSLALELAEDVTVVSQSLWQSFSAIAVSSFMQLDSIIFISLI